MDEKPTILLDFDGCVHSYTSPWQGAAVIADDATPGFFEWADRAAQVFRLAIYSSRSKEPGGIAAMQAWLVAQREKWLAAGGQPTADAAARFSFPLAKPPAFVTIDDRAITFLGCWDDLDPEALLAFEPWNRKSPKPE